MIDNISMWTFTKVLNIFFGINNILGIMLSLNGGNTWSAGFFTIATLIHIVSYHCSCLAIEKLKEDDKNKTN